jgi:hypothetical protein
VSGIGAASVEEPAAVEARLEIRSPGDDSFDAVVGAVGIGIGAEPGVRKTNTPAARKRPPMIAQMNLMRSRLLQIGRFKTEGRSSYFRDDPRLLSRW